MEAADGMIDLSNSPLAASTVATGAANRQIAERFVISETVTPHLSNIFTKLDLSSVQARGRQAPA